MSDLIDRQAALQAMETWDKFGCGPDGKLVRYDDDNHYVPYVHYDDMVHAIKHLPSAQPEQRWIPVTERLPDELAEVNVTWKNTDPEPYYGCVKGHCFTGTAVYYRGRWFWYSAVCVDYLREYGFSPNDEMDDAIKVLAWMPLPEPYREEEQDG